MGPLAVTACEEESQIDVVSDWRGAFSYWAGSKVRELALKLRTIAAWPSQQVVVTSSEGSGILTSRKLVCIVAENRLLTG